jgi:hypothetical protein
VEEGYYQEPWWDVPHDRDVTIKGVNKELTFVTVGIQNSENFIYISTTGMIYNIITKLILK